MVTKLRYEEGDGRSFIPRAHKDVIFRVIV
jgi:hypothetical protein